MHRTCVAADVSCCLKMTQDGERSHLCIIKIVRYGQEPVFTSPMVGIALVAGTGMHSLSCLYYRGTRLVCRRVDANGAFTEVVGVLIYVHTLCKVFFTLYPLSVWAMDAVNAVRIVGWLPI